MHESLKLLLLLFILTITSKFLYANRLQATCESLYYEHLFKMEEIFFIEM